MILLLSVTCMNLTSTWYIYLVYSFGRWVALARCSCRSKRIKCWQFWEIMQVKKVLTKLPKKLNSSYIFPFLFFSKVNFKGINDFELNRKNIRLDLVIIISVTKHLVSCTYPKFDIIEYQFQTSDWHTQILYFMMTG